MYYLGADFVSFTHNIRLSTLDWLNRLRKEKLQNLASKEMEKQEMYLLASYREVMY